MRSKYQLKQKHSVYINKRSHLQTHASRPKVVHLFKKKRRVHINTQYMNGCMCNCVCACKCNEVEKKARKPVSCFILFFCQCSSSYGPHCKSSRFRSHHLLHSICWFYTSAQTHIHRMHSTYTHIFALYALKFGWNFFVRIFIPFLSILNAETNIYVLSKQNATVNTPQQNRKN